MRRQIEAVRKLGRNFEDATAYVIVEANLGVTAATVYSHLAGMPNVEFMWTARAANDGRLPGGMVDADGGIRAGLWTLNKHKHAMMDRISAYLRSGAHPLVLRSHWLRHYGPRTRGPPARAVQRGRHGAQAALRPHSAQSR